jgi:hypothetical protein
MATRTPERASTTPPLSQPTVTRRGRPKLSAKVSEAQETLRTHTTALRSSQHAAPSTITTTNATTAHAEPLAGIANLDVIARLIASLKDTITKQSTIIENRNKTIEDIRADLIEIKSEQQTLKNQNSELINKQQSAIEDLSKRLKETQAELRELKQPVEKAMTEIERVKTQSVEELKHVREKLDTIMKCPALSPSVNTSPNPSYADVARTPPNSAPANLNSISSMGTTPSTMTDTLYCTIDVSRVANEDANKASAGAIRTAVEKEIRTLKDHTNWRCRAVTKDAKNTTRIRIACRDEDEQRMIKQVAETKIASGIRVMRDELYPIKVDNVNRLAVLDDKGEIQAGAAEALSQENDTTVAKIAWLSRKDVPKAYGSMVVYITKGSDARRLLAEGFFHAGGESGTTSVFERRPRPEQCYNCQESGHKAFQCKKAQKCARCAKEGHHHGNCNEAVLRCVPCGGPHESFSRNCRKLYPPQHE